MKVFDEKRILLVGAHPDDIEISCSGTIAKYQSRTSACKSIIFAPCLEDPLNKGILEEYEKSMKMLGIKEALHHNYPRDILENYIQEIRDLLHNLKQSFNPEVIFCPSLNDLHQDHRAIASACQTIFRDSATVLSYEIVRSTVNFTPNLYVSLSQANMKFKLQLLKNYKTQARRSYFKPEIVKSIAIYRGCQVIVQYAEAFEIWRMTDK